MPKERIRTSTPLPVLDPESSGSAELWYPKIDLGFASIPHVARKNLQLHPLPQSLNAASIRGWSRRGIARTYCSVLVQIVIEIVIDGSNKSPPEPKSESGKWLCFQSALTCPKVGNPLIRVRSVVRVYPDPPAFARVSEAQAATPEPKEAKAQRSCSLMYFSRSAGLNNLRTSSSKKHRRPMHTASGGNCRPSERRLQKAQCPRKRSHMSRSTQTLVKTHIELADERRALAFEK